MVNAVDWNQLNTGSNPVPIETFTKDGFYPVITLNLNHTLNYQHTKKSVEVKKKMYIIIPKSNIIIIYVYIYHIQF